MNRIANCGNQFQGEFKRVLCVCSAGLLRSPTAAFVLSQEPFNFNTRAAGLVPQFALIPVDSVLLNWAHEIVCMEPGQAYELAEMLEAISLGTKAVKCLSIEDNYSYRDPALMQLIAERYGTT